MTDQNGERRAVFWFTNDLRIADNAALRLAAQNSDQLLCIYVIEPGWFQPNRYGLKAMGFHRWQFLQASLKDLQKSLAKYNQNVLIKFATPLVALSDIIEQYKITHVFRSQNTGYYEDQNWQRLEQHYSHLTFTELATHTLFSPSVWPQASIPLEESMTFSRFRKHVEKTAPDDIVDAPRALPATPYKGRFVIPPVNIQTTEPTASHFRGGESEGRNHCISYFSTLLASSYKQSRNALDGWENSTKFSTWLANGALSARQVHRCLREYEKNIGANDSSYWIYFELLWREYFHWLAQSASARLFALRGIQNKKTLTCFYPERFKRWCMGTTPYPLVNACMNQLNRTGYLSNRGRQIVASCLVNELQLDWRYGAAYFEQQLIDYDVAVNWGNWQYLAGVGTDPKGKRHFNIAKQTQLFDPSGVFIRKWQGDATNNDLDSVDAADWPITPT